MGERLDDLGTGLNKRIDDLRSDMQGGFASVDKRLDRLHEKVAGLQERSWR